MNHRIIAILILLMPVCVWAESLQKKYSARLTPPRVYDCYRSEGKIKLDGALDDEAWQGAQWSEEFVDISGFEFPMPAQSTRVKMLYDD